MNRVESDLKGFRKGGVSLIFPTIFITVFSSVWVTIAVATKEIPMMVASLIPFLIFGVFVWALIYNFSMYALYKKVLKRGERIEVNVLDKSGGLESNHQNKYRLRLEFKYNGEYVRKWSPRVFTDWEANALVAKGRVEALQYKKNALITDHVEKPYDEFDDEYEDEYDHEYDPRPQSTHKQAEPIGNSAFAVQKAATAKPVHIHKGAARLCALGDQGNKDAIAVQKQTSTYRQLRYCALNNVDEEVIEALWESVTAGSVAAQAKQQMEWYRGLRSEINQPLEDSIRILDFISAKLQKPEVEDLMRCIILESEKTEQFLLPSAIVRKLNEYRKELDKN